MLYSLLSPDHTECLIIIVTIKSGIYYNNVIIIHVMGGLQFLCRMSDPDQALPALVDLERRVRTLEHQVQRLTNTVVSSRPSIASAGSNRGNNFWYVVTFTGWMMVPLIVVFMYHLKKSL